MEWNKRSALKDVELGAGGDKADEGEAPDKKRFIAVPCNGFKLSEHPESTLARISEPLLSQPYTQLMFVNVFVGSVFHTFVLVVGRF